MKDDNVPMATILCLVGTLVIGLAGDAVIFMIAPPPISVRHIAWWGLVGLGVVHYFGAGAVSHYLSAFDLPAWFHIVAWTHHYPGYWRWLVVARWWWLVASMIALLVTFRWVWRTPNGSDQHRRGTRLSHDLRAYQELIHELKHERD